MMQGHGIVGGWQAKLVSCLCSVNGVGAAPLCWRSRHGSQAHTAGLPRADRVKVASRWLQGWPITRSSCWEIFRESLSLEGLGSSSTPVARCAGGYVQARKRTGRHAASCDNICRRRRLRSQVARNLLTAVHFRPTPTHLPHPATGLNWGVGAAGSRFWRPRCGDTAGAAPRRAAIRGAAKQRWLSSLQFLQNAWRYSPHLPTLLRI